MTRISDSCFDNPQRKTFFANDVRVAEGLNLNFGAKNLDLRPDCFEPQCHNQAFARSYGVQRSNYRLASFSLLSHPYPCFPFFTQSRIYSHSHRIRSTPYGERGGYRSQPGTLSLCLDLVERVSRFSLRRLSLQLLATLPSSTTLEGLRRRNWPVRTWRLPGSRPSSAIDWLTGQSLGSSLLAGRILSPTSLLAACS